MYLNGAAGRKVAVKIANRKMSIYPLFFVIYAL
jgi:hypothetical protein